MVEKAAKRVVTCCLHNHVIDEERREVYEYGMELFIATIISLGSVLGVGVMLQRFCYTLCLVIPFCHIRVYAGGIHAETYTKCFLSFFAGFLLILLGTEYLVCIGFRNGVMWSSFFSFIIIWLFSPVEDHSRPLNGNERIKYNEKARIMALIYELTAQIIDYLWQPEEIIYVAAAVHAVAIVLVLGIIKNKRTGFRPVYICRNKNM